ncbi:MAG: Ig-like domain repeat protein, partial [Methanobrevibacter sp.]|nr:Ig-like domain repeat protein [Methanobrevibacter sp.]
RTSNETGHVKMNINLNPGTYIITANYKGLMAANIISVNPILEASDLSMQYRDGSKFESRLLDSQGNPFANKTVTYNINGVFYNRTTDSEGIARLNINQMAGEYIITSMYENGAAIANKVTVRS